MSSAEEDGNQDIAAQAAKKRRLQRACDICRRKKVRCDGGQKPDQRCTNCANNKHECTYIEASKKRHPPKGYVEELESKVQKMEALLRKFCPDIDLSQELGGNIDKDSGHSEPSRSSSTVNVSSICGIPPPPPSSNAENLEPSDDEIAGQESLENSIKKMETNPAHISFFGKSSSALFVQTAIEAKHEYAGVDMLKDELRDHLRAQHQMLIARRPQFWNVQPWITSTPVHHEAHTFPDQDLMISLIDLYFTHINVYLPVLHRPTFEKNINSGLHLRDEGFGIIVLLVCAIGSRFSDDPRVLLEGSDSTHSCGWAWFRQVQLTRKSLLSPPRLSDVQFCCLATLFLGGTSAPQTCWTLVGVGLRLAQDVGAHRRKVYNSSSTVEEELWKRAFWVLVFLDRTMGMGLGRPCAIQDEDFDLEMPVECDDEYWVANESGCQFKQPSGKPSTIIFFNCMLRLIQILGFALRTIYSINKSKVLLGFVGQQWEQRIVAELDSALNKWIDAVPDHLRWDPNMESDLFLNQSAFLYSHYYNLQIAVHRPFIPSPKKPSPLSFPSLAICTNAARSCIHVLDVPFRRRLQSSVLYLNLMPLFSSGIVLLLNIWGGKRSGLSLHYAKEMADIHMCMKMVKSLEPRWLTAGRLWDVLCDLASVGDLPLPQPSPAPRNQKRERDWDASHVDDPLSSATLDANSLITAPTEQKERDIAGSDRVPRDFMLRPQQQEYLPNIPLQNNPQGPTPTFDSNYALPIYTEELGRLPLHPDYSAESSNSTWSNPSYASSLSATQPATMIDPTVDVSDPELDHFMATMFSSSPSMFEQAMSGFAPFLPSDTQPDSSGSTTIPITGRVDVSATPSDGVFPENDTLAMWSNAPQGFEWDDWGSYISSVSHGGVANPAEASNGPPILDSSQLRG